MSNFFDPQEDRPTFTGGAFGEPPPTSTPYAPKGFCGQHPEVSAVATCQTSRTPVCATCDFEFPGGLHFCPACATQKSQPMSSSRKTMLGWSFVAATWVTFFLGVLLSGALEEAAMEEPGATIVGTLILLPGLIGMGLAISSYDSRAGNPVAVWISLIWNIVLFVAWVGLMIVGLTMT